MSNQSDKVKRWRKKLKVRILKSFGEQCGICGYNKCAFALEVHHLNPKEKEFSLSRTDGKPWDKIVLELRKCVLLCANCHREVHSNITLISDNIQKYNEEFTNYMLDEKEELLNRKQQDKEIKQREKKEAKTIADAIKQEKLKERKLLASQGIDRVMKVDWSKIDLEEMKRKYSNVQIGELLGISETAVRRRLNRVKKISTI